MAHLLASIYGTEKDKVNCSFYFKIGACRHGETCSRKHVKPTFSPTMCMPNLYRNPTHDPFNQLTRGQLQEHLDLFYEDIFLEMNKFGEVDEVIICDNIGEHLIGNVYVRFKDEESAMKARNNVNNRFYAGTWMGIARGFSNVWSLLSICDSLRLRALSPRSPMHACSCSILHTHVGRPIYAELSPVTDFREACCRQFEMNECNRGGYCNFMHVRYPAPELKRAIFQAQKAEMKLRRHGGGGVVDSTAVPATTTNTTTTPTENDTEQ